MGRRRGTAGASRCRGLDVNFAILDRVDEVPTVSRDARVKAHVDVHLADVAPEYERRA
jgi:hypothetical protein